MRPHVFRDGDVSGACTVFAVSLLALGVIHVVSGEAVTRVFPQWPEGLPGRPYWAHAAGGVLVVLGAMAALRWHAQTALRAVAVLITVSVLALHLPRAIPSGEVGDAWVNVFKWAAMAAGAWLVAASMLRGVEVTQGKRWASSGSAPAAWLMAGFMIGAAVLHLRFASGLAEYYIPAYIPWRIFWAYFTAGTLAAGGVGLLIPRTARLAALLTSLMIFLWFLTLHIPRTVAEPRSPGEWSGIFESLAFAVIAFVLAAARGDHRRAPLDRQVFA